MNDQVRWIYIYLLRWAKPSGYTHERILKELRIDLYGETE